MKREETLQNKRLGLRDITFGLYLEPNANNPTVKNIMETEKSENF